MVKLETQKPRGAPHMEAEAIVKKPPQAELRPHDTLLTRYQWDGAALLGLVLVFAVIIVAVWLAGAHQAYLGALSLAAALVVLGGTLAVTLISSGFADLAQSVLNMGKVIRQPRRDPQAVCHHLLELAVEARRVGALGLQDYALQVEADNPLLSRGLYQISDGATETELALGLETEIARDRHLALAAARVMRRAAEVAPAMGLIGTLIGLVAMLFQLDDPAKIGPPMAIALLTTLYGAMLGTVFLNPLAAKMEQQAEQEGVLRLLYREALLSIQRKENPRKLQMALNMILPPHQHVAYFD